MRARFVRPVLCLGTALSLSVGVSGGVRAPPRSRGERGPCAYGLGFSSSAVYPRLFARSGRVSGSDAGRRARPTPSAAVSGRGRPCEWRRARRCGLATSVLPTTSDQT